MENTFVGFAVDLVEDTAEDFESLIEIKEEQGELLVSGRDLHKALEVGTPYKNGLIECASMVFQRILTF